MKYWAVLFWIVLTAATLNAAPTYCPISPAFGYQVWIERVQLHDLDSGNTGVDILTRYSNYSVLETGVVRDTSYTLTLTPGYTLGLGAKWAIYIDWNQNGIFDISELVAEKTGGLATTTLSVAIPSTAVSGRTRMRIIVADVDTETPLPACGSIPNGEAEDYSIFITYPISAPTYCSVTSATKDRVKIKQVQLEEIQQFTRPTAGSPGYHDLRYRVATISKGDYHNLILATAWTNPVPVRYSIYIDGNQDGDFLDPDELVIKDLFQGQGDPDIFMSMRLPDTFKDGFTTMRVIVEAVYDTKTGAPLPLLNSPCGVFDQGEAFDFGVQIFDPASDPLFEIKEVAVRQVAPGTVWVVTRKEISGGATGYEFRYRREGQDPSTGENYPWINISGSLYTITIGGLEAGFRYEIQARASGGGEIGGHFSPLTTFGVYREASMAPTEELYMWQVECGDILILNSVTDWATKYRNYAYTHETELKVINDRMDTMSWNDIVWQIDGVPVDATKYRVDTYVLVDLNNDGKFNTVEHEKSPWRGEMVGSFADELYPIREKTPTSRYQLKHSFPLLKNIIRKYGRTQMRIIVVRDNKTNHAWGTDLVGEVFDFTVTLGIPGWLADKPKHGNNGPTLTSD